jgi:hypothetical protein
MGYKLLGWVVWNVARWVIRRKLRGVLPGGKVAVAGLVVAVAAAALAARRR